MTFQYAPYSAGSPAGASLTDAEWSEFAKALLGTGVIKGALISGAAGQDFLVSAPGGVMSVNIGTGQAMVYGHWCMNDATLAQTIAAADPTNPRIDTIVLEHNVAAKTLSVVVKQGTPAPSPSAPALTQTPSTWDYALVNVTVPAAATTIVAGNLTDLRTFAFATLGGLAVGNLSGNVPISNGVLNPNLNAQLLNGLASSAFAQAGSHSTVSPVKVSAGTVLPASLDANEIFFLLS